MSLIGKEIRMKKLIDKNTGKMIILPMDHGITMGPIYGIENAGSSIKKIMKTKINALVIHKGILTKYYKIIEKNIAIILHMSASTNLSFYPNYKVLISSVREAIKLGADAVSVHINIGCKHESKMLRDFGKISEEANELGVPLLAMIYPRGSNIEKKSLPSVIGHAARIAAEMGADIVKVPYTGSVNTFEKVVNGCPIPVIISGGNIFDSDSSILKIVEESIKAGSAGVSIGRNIFQHKNSELIIKKIRGIVFHGKSVKEAMRIID